METVDAPKKWFQLHVDTVMQAYGLEHRIQREDLLLGTRHLYLLSSLYTFTLPTF